MASSKTFLRPFWVRAEHSRYLIAPSDVLCRAQAKRGAQPDGSDFLAALDALRVADGLHALLAQPVERLGIVAQIQLGADEDDGDVGRVVRDLGVPLHAQAVSSPACMRRGRAHEPWRARCQTTEG